MTIKELNDFLNDIPKEHWDKHILVNLNDYNYVMTLSNPTPIESGVRVGFVLSKGESNG